MKIKVFPLSKRKIYAACMHLTFLFALCSALPAHAQNQKVTLSKGSQTILAAFEAIEKQLGMTVAFNETTLDVNQTIVVDVFDDPLSLALVKILRDKQASYKIQGNQIIIVPLPKKSITVTGTVIDSSTGITIPGASVIVKGSMIGSVTNNNGEYRIALPVMRDYILTFSFIGYKSQDVKVNEDKENLQIMLEPAVQQVEEVVATGYQVIDKRILTSAVSSIKSEELDMKNALTVDQMLEGKAVGLEVTNISSTPGAAAKIRVRSSNTFTGNQSPLWVIDGVIYEDPVPLSNDDINSFDNVNLIGNALTGINPQDIQSIDVLKDASATAIYGVRAAGGVISITTKRGSEGAPKLAYSFNGSFVQAPSYKDFNLMNSKDRIDVSREMASRNLGYSSNSYYENSDRIGYEGALMDYWDSGDFNAFQKQVSNLETLNADWFGELYSPAYNQAHSLNVSGGNKTSRYYTSLGYDKQDGTETGISIDRITARANVDFDLRKNITLSLKINGSVQEAAYNHSSINLFDEAYYNSRTVPIYNEDGSYFFQQRLLSTSTGSIKTDATYGRYNILNEIENSEKNITNKEFSIQAQLSWKNIIVKNLDFSSRMSYRNTTNLQEEWIDAETFYVAKLRTYDAVEDYIQKYSDLYATVPVGGLYSGGMIDQTSYSMTNQLNYRKVFNRKHVFNVNASQEVRSTHYWGATGFTVPGYSHHNGRNFISLPSVNINSSSLSRDFDSYVYDNIVSWFAGDIYPSITDKLNNSMSFFGILSYVYDNRYIANFNMRSDGTNSFGQYKEYRFKPTWSVSGRWNVHNEQFMANNNIFDELAFRVSYGVRGTIPTATPYLTVKDYGPETTNGYFNFGENVASLNSFPQTNLRWEINKTTNIGINYSLYQGRISGSLDYAYSFSDDLILTRPASLANGTSSQSYNGGSKDVQSYEFSIRTVNVKTNDFSWSTNFNFSSDIDRVLKGYELNSGSSINVSKYLNGGIYTKGFPSSGFYSYKFEGLNEEGLPTFANIYREDLMADEQLKAMLQYEGQRNPQYYGGFGTAVKYKRLTLSASFSYKLGYKVRLLELYNGQQNLPLPYENMSSEFNNRWRQAGDEAHTDIPGLSNNDMFLMDYTTNYSKGIFPSSSAKGSVWELYDYSTARTVKGDHIRWNALSLSYQVPAKFVNKMGLSSFSLGASANNLAVWAFDKDLDGQDPNQVRSIGMPSLPTYNFSLNVSL
ncbi:MAG: SusC/RagA family TonB-linked outer membrane protein [Mangrovibacterium sp.]